MSECQTKQERFAWLNCFVSLSPTGGDVRHDLNDCEIFEKTSDKHFLFQEYLARLGIDTRAPHLSQGSSYQTLEENIMRGDMMAFSRLQDTDAMSDKNSLVSGGANSVYARTWQPSVSDGVSLQVIIPSPTSTSSSV